jgi:hypothetical protein
MVRGRPTRLCLDGPGGTLEETLVVFNFRVAPKHQGDEDQRYWRGSFAGLCEREGVQAPNPQPNVPFDPRGSKPRTEFLVAALDEAVGSFPSAA